MRLQDYRDVEGEYDAIVSVEMIEAVGEEFWPSYFSTIDEHLAPGGRVAIQAITMAHDRMLATRNSYGWIQKHIFPGGLIPSIQAIEEVCDDAHLAPHHATAVSSACTTPRRCAAGVCGSWRTGTTSPTRATTRSFRRIWEFYLAYCEAGFRSRYLGVSQIRLDVRPRLSLPDGPARPSYRVTG